MKPPVVLLVEDDASVRRFVRMSLENLPLQLIECDSVACALDTLQKGPADLILTDLMMPGETGFDLLDHLQRRPALRGQAKLMVISAGINAQVREQLAQYDLSRILVKPVPVAELEDCIASALADLMPSELPANQPNAVKTAAGLTPEQTQAITEYFQGDESLFTGFLAACRAQFPQDIAAGSRALASQDLRSLRLTVHSLKSILLTLGYGELSVLALSIEHACVAGDQSLCKQGWAQLSAGLQKLASPSA